MLASILVVVVRLGVRFGVDGGAGGGAGCVGEPVVDGMVT